MNQINFNQNIMKNSQIINNERNQIKIDVKKKVNDAKQNQKYNRSDNFPFEDVMMKEENKIVKSPK